MSESGTGIGQVLAILYVVLTSDYERTIIIDEPQSFLHPGATRKLFEILREYSQHQYIVTTHSPTVVTAADPQTIFIVRKEEAESSIEPIDVTETQKLRFYLSEIGARLADVFGADNILWVEGPTEEQCFPIILEKVIREPLMGTQIIGVKHTGDLEGKHSQTVFDIYERLSGGRGLLPPSIGFIFDKEKRTSLQIADLRRQSKGLVSFTPRRMYENYLLNPHAIAAIMSQIEDFSDAPLTATRIEEWLRDNKWNNEYIQSKSDPEDRTEEKWIENVHGARILESAFRTLSENRFSYDKIEHGLALTKWIVEHAPSDLEEVADLLSTALARRPNS